MAALMRGTGLITACLLVLAACEPTPTDLDLAGRSVSLHAMLVADAPHATVVLTELQPVGPSGQLVAVPVTGARMYLISDADTVHLVQGASPVPCAAPHWSGGNTMQNACYSSAVEGGVRAGRRHDLHVVLPDGRIVRGTTVVPHPASLLQPEAGAEIAVLRHNAAGQPPPSAIGWQGGQTQRMELRVASGVRECAVLQTGTAGELWQVTDVTGLTGALLRLRVSCQPEHDSAARLSAEVLLMSYDANYAAHLRSAQAGGPPPYGDESNGITGAFGVFGSAARASAPVTLVVQ
jgi:hypothetical protein